MARDLAEWADLAERAAHENAAYEELAAWQGAMAAVLRAVASYHQEVIPDRMPGGYCSGCGGTWPCPGYKRLVAVVAPLLGDAP